MDVYNYVTDVSCFINMVMISFKVLLNIKYKQLKILKEKKKEK